MTMHKSMRTHKKPHSKKPKHPTKHTTKHPTKHITKRITQRSSQKTTASQSEMQNLYVKNSKKVTVKQTSTEMLSTTQKALNTAIQTIIAMAKQKNLEIDEQALQQIIQDLNSKQSATQKTQIINSSEVRIEQDEVEQARLMQQAMNLLEECIRKM